MLLKLLQQKAVAAMADRKSQAKLIMDIFLYNFLGIHFLSFKNV